MCHCKTTNTASRDVIFQVLTDNALKMLGVVSAGQEEIKQNITILKLSRQPPYTYRLRLNRPPILSGWNLAGQLHQRGEQPATTQEKIQQVKAF